ncbi:MAG: hypothetical protein KGL75_00970 [Acidobacteriota bacterium]|nr:hypothetical protein [Acidobacteriota bacterium]
MKLLLALLVAALVAAFGVPSLHSQSGDAANVLPWAGDGNNFLSHCDETDALFPTSKMARVNALIPCDSWITGLAEGIILTQKTDVDPLRSKVGLLSPEAKKLLEANQEAAARIATQLEAMGAEKVSTPDSDMCLSPSIPVDQLRRVIIKWMKDNPKLLNQNPAELAFAALRNTYPCPDGVTLNDWTGKH